MAGSVPGGAATTAQGGRKKPKIPDSITDQKFSEAKLHRAQDLIYDAWDTDNRSKRLDLAYQALAISPYCTDAYNLLAHESQDPKEKLALYEKGVLAGKLSLGDLIFKTDAGHFWGILETRPYMRALAGMAEALWETGRRLEAIGTYRELLRLNHNDNQGIRYLLVNCYLEEEMDQDAARLLAEHQDELSCFLEYSRVLLAYRTLGDHEVSKAVLDRALKVNRHVPAYLSGNKRLPFPLPAYYTFGGEDEAVTYVSEAGKAWQRTPGALEWLAKRAKRVIQP